MKIHIVQKGDTLWNLAQKYGVDFEELLEANSHLANPDLIMPGMKVKIPTIAVPAKKEAVKGKTVAPKQAVKKEVKEIKKELPKMEWEPPQVVAETEHSQLKEMVKKAAPHVLKKLLVEHKPEVVQEIKIEIINQQEAQFKMAHPVPMPKAEPYIPPKPMPMPKMVAPQAMHPCPPLKPMHMGPMHHCPKCGFKKHHGMHHGMHHAGYPTSAPMPPQTWEMGTPGQGLGSTPQYAPGYGMMPGTPMGGYGEQYMQPGTGMGPLGHDGYFGQNIPTGSYMGSYMRSDEEQKAEEQQD